MSGHAARIARDHCLAPERVDGPISGGRYRSLFEDLPPFSVDEQALHGNGAKPSGLRVRPSPSASRRLR